ncbi:hypothetical protein B9C75_08660 [Bifidobacterium bifidum]|nr:hypothetical protein B9C75_08660 [Bifidobacterium bifidum]
MQHAERAVVVKTQCHALHCSESSCAAPYSSRSRHHAWSGRRHAVNGRPERGRNVISAGYLRFEGVTRTLWNIYLHFEGLVAEYQWHGSRMIPVASIMQYLEYRATPTP